MKEKMALKDVIKKSNIGSSRVHDPNCVFNPSNTGAFSRVHESDRVFNSSNTGAFSWVHDPDQIFNPSSTEQEVDFIIKRNFISLV